MAARSAPASSVHSPEEHKAARTLQSHYRGHVIRQHSRNMLAGVARYGKRGLAIHNEIMKRTHEFAILLMPGADLHIVHDALRKEEVRGGEGGESRMRAYGEREREGEGGYWDRDVGPRCACARCGCAVDVLRTCSCRGSVMCCMCLCVVCPNVHMSNTQCSTFLM